MAATKKMLLVVSHGSGWTGGVYYVRNLLVTLLQNPDVRSWEFLILCPDEHKGIFAPMLNQGNIKILRRNPMFDRMNFWMMKGFRVFKKDFPLDVVYTALKYKVDAVFPVMGYPIPLLGPKCVHWIPDFQHLKIPEFFSPLERRQKDGRFEAIGKSGNKLILSSHDAAAHFADYFPGATTRTFVIPFLSDIEEWVDSLTLEREREVLAKFGLLEGEFATPYLYVPNQFWRHKNHRTAFRGFAEYRRRHPDSRLTLVCTGNTRDYRFATFFESLLQDLKSLELGDSVKILSFLERQEQMVILKNCQALLQPSLFEGWGTGVQEAKRFAKPLLLSDIPIHREQGDDRSLYFLPLVPASMADALDALEAAPFVPVSPTVMKARYYATAAEYSKDAHLLAEP